MEPLISHWTYFLPFAIVFVWVFATELPLMLQLRKWVGESPQQDARSTWMLVIGNPLSLGLGFALAFEVPSAAIKIYRLPLFVGGLTMIVAGVALRRHCIHMLGRRFTGSVVVRPGQSLITDGAYRWVRHPSYTAAMMIFLGVALCLANWLALIVIVPTNVAIYAYRAAVEERALVSVVGDRYLDYMKRTKRFLPFLV